MSDKFLSGKTALITGSTSGIGTTGGGEPFFVER